MRQHQPSEARVSVVARRRVFNVINLGGLIEIFTGTIVWASVGLERIAPSVNAYNRHPMHLLGMKFVDQTNSRAASFTAARHAARHYFDGAATTAPRVHRIRYVGTRRLRDRPGRQVVVRVITYRRDLPGLTCLQSC
jgi:hypothetical protein